MIAPALRALQRKYSVCTSQEYAVVAAYVTDLTRCSVLGPTVLEQQEVLKELNVTIKAHIAATGSLPAGHELRIRTERAMHNLKTGALELQEITQRSRTQLEGAGLLTLYDPKNFDLSPEDGCSASDAMRAELKLLLDYVRDDVRSRLCRQLCGRWHLPEHIGEIVVVLAIGDDHALELAEL